MVPPNFPTEESCVLNFITSQQSPPPKKNQHVTSISTEYIPLLREFLFYFISKSHNYNLSKACWFYLLYLCLNVLTFLHL